MQNEEQQLLKELLTNINVLSLGVLIDQSPYVGLLPFAGSADFCELFIHASRLALHTRGLSDGAPYSALIHAPEQPGSSDPLQLPRLTVLGTVRVLQRDSEGWISARELYIRKFPQSEQTFLLGDFNLYALDIVRGRLVAGFARTVNINKDHLRSLRR